MTSVGSRSRLWPLMLVALIAAACGGDDSTDEAAPIADDAPLIVVTTTILGDLVSTLVGDDAEVEILMPPGSDPHDFEPSARQAASLRDADLVVANGFDLEIGLLGALDSARDDGATVVEVGEFIDPLAFGATSHDHDDDHADADDDHADDDHDDHADDDHDDDHADDDHADDHADDDHADDHGHGEWDPHFWHDPRRMADAVGPLADAIAEAVPALSGDELESRAEALAEELREVDLRVEDILSVVPDDRRFILTNHDTFGYFADRYGFEVVGTIIPGGDTLASPSTADLAGLVTEIEEHDLRAVFAESVAANDLANALASEVGAEVEVVTLYTDALGPADSDAETYAGMLTSNALLVADALS